MNSLQRLIRISPPSPSVSEEERRFVAQFGGAARNIRYVCRSDLVGLLVTGKKSGLRVEKHASGRRLRRVQVIGKDIVPTSESFILRLDDSGRSRNINLNNYVY